jgi:acyl-CoA thioesterase
MTPFSTLMGSLHSEGSTYCTEIPEGWQQGRTTFGGLTAALCLAATEREVPDLPPLRSAQFTFVRPVAGAVTVEPRLLRRGKSSAFVAVGLSTEGELATQGILSFGASRDTRYEYRAQPMPQVPPPGSAPGFFRAGKPQFVQHFEGFAAGGEKLVSGAKTPELLLWLRHRDPAAMAQLPGVLALGDTPPAAAYTMLTAPAPVSSITWSVEMINPGAALAAKPDAWYLLRSRGEDVREGYSVQDMTLWSEDGKLITLARQTVAIFA